MNQKKVTEHVSCKCKCNILVENVTQMKRGRAITVDVSLKIGQNIMMLKTLYLESCYIYL